VELASDVALSATACFCMSLRRISSSTGAPVFAAHQRRVFASGSQRSLVTASVQEHQALIAAAHRLTCRGRNCLRADGCGVRLRDRGTSRGVAVVDIGLESSGLVVYDGEKLIFASSIP
jgi:hypothetical protein